MLIYLGMLIAVAAFGFRSIAAVGRNRFPHAADVATISTIYYAVPLSMAGYFSVNYRELIFLSSAAADAQLAFQSMTFVVVALAFMQIGRSTGSVIIVDQVSLFAKLSTQSTIRTGVLLSGLIAITGLGVWLFGFNEFLAGYATESDTGTAGIGNALVYLAVELIGLAIAFTLLIGKARGKTPLKLLLAIAIIVLLAVLAVRAKRLEVVAAFIPAAILLLSRRASFSTTTWRLLGASAAVAVLVLISAVRTSDTLDPFKALYYFFSEGLYAGHSLPGIIDRINLGMIGYENGLRFINAVLGFIPRLFWPEKDEMVYAGNQVLDGVAPLGATNILAEIVLQGGYVAVAICYFLMGYLFERLSKFEAIWDDAIAQGYAPIRFGFYVIALAIFIPHFRDGIIPAIKLSLQAAVFVLILMGATRLVTRLVDRPAPTADDRRQPSPVIGKS